MSHQKLVLQIFIFVAFIFVTNADNVNRNEFGLKNEKIKLICDLPNSGHFYFVWKDKVYNEKSNPSVIYNSTLSEIDKKYKEIGFTVFENVLYVQDAQRDASGDYFCDIYLKNGTIISTSYGVHIIMDKKCTEDGEAKEGDPVSLHCNFSASFSFPPKWVDERGMKYESEFFSEFDTHALLASFNATWQHDKTTFKCMTEDLAICSNTLNVIYKARDITLPTGDRNLHPGDNVTCTVLGNPIPQVTLELKEYSKVSGVGEVSIQILEDLIGQKLSARCEAWNDVGGDVTKLIQESSLLVVEKPLNKQSLLDDGNNSFLMIIIITVAVVLLVLVVGSIIILNRKKCKKDPKKPKGTTLLKAEPRKDYNSDMI